MTKCVNVNLKNNKSSYMQKKIMFWNLAHVLENAIKSAKLNNI